MTVSPQFTVLLPVNRPPHLLPFAIESVLAQERAAFELFIVCDGAPAATVECAQAYAARDARIRVFAFEKGQRHGEAHRHTALASARAPFVAQIADDDLWFPDFLSTLGRLLERVDFGHLLQGDLAADGELMIHMGDLADEAVRRRMCEQRWNIFGPSVAGYRLCAYRRLPVGWSPAPPGDLTDLHMWRKFLGRSDLTFGTHFAVHGVRVDAQSRAAMSEEARQVETAAVVRQLADPHERAALVARGFRASWNRLHRAQTEWVQAQAQVEAQAAVEAQRQVQMQATVSQLQVAQEQAQQAAAEQRDAMRQANQLLAAERDALRALHAQITASKSWRWTRPLRWGRGRI